MFHFLKWSLFFDAHTGFCLLYYRIVFFEGLIVPRCICKWCAHYSVMACFFNLSADECIMRFILRILLLIYFWNTFFITRVYLTKTHVSAFTSAVVSDFCTLLLFIIIYLLSFIYYYCYYYIFITILLLYYLLTYSYMYIYVYFLFLFLYFYLFIG